jgi:hypothetical protein
MTDIFSNGFEEGNFSAWTSTTGSPSISTDQKHHGTYSCKANIVANATTYAYAYKTVTDNAELYARAYFLFTDPPGVAWNYERVFSLAHSTNSIVTLGVRYAGSTHRFFLRYLSSGTTYTETNYDLNTTIDTGAWYCLEIYCKIATDSTGVATLWVDGVQRINVGSLDNDNYADHLDRVNVGITTASNEAMETYCDCVYVDTVAVGQESTGVTVKKGGNLGGMMTQMLNSKMLFSAVNRFPKYNVRSF